MNLNLTLNLVLDLTMNSTMNLTLNLSLILKQNLCSKQSFLSAVNLASAEDPESLQTIHCSSTLWCPGHGSLRQGEDGG